MGRAIGGFDGRNAREALSFGLALVFAGACAGVRADDLTEFALPAETRVYAPGNGVATNVSEKIDGAVNVQANDGSTGGGIVTLSNSENAFTGGAYVKSGTLAVPSVDVALRPSALGRFDRWTGTRLVLGNGTFHYTGPSATLDGDVLITSDQSLNYGRRPAVVKVDDELVLTGQVKVDGTNSAAFMKSGPGTLILRTRLTGVQNTFAQGGQIGFNSGYVNAPANGDSPSACVSSFQVTEGRFVIDTADTVTNVFGSNESGVGIRSTNKAGGETAAYLDIYGGVNKFGNWLCAARNNGDTTTAPQGLRSEITVYGGDTSANNFGLAYCAANSSDFTMTGVMTVHGGRLGCTTLRVDHTKSRGEVNVDGGTFDVKDAWIANYNAGAHFTANVSGTGVFRVSNYFDANKTGSATTTINVSENGLFDCNAFAATKADGDVSIHADGGTLQMRGDWTAGRLLVGAAGTTVRSYNGETRQWKLPVASEGGVADGGVDVAGTGEIDFSGAIALAGGLRVNDADVGLKNASCAAVVEQKGTGVVKTFATPVAMSGLVQSGTATVKIGFAGTTPSAIATAAWTPPATLRLHLLQSDMATPFATAGDYALLTFPAAVEFDAADAQVVNAPRGLDCALRVVDNGDGTKTLRVAISEDEEGAAAANTIYLPNGYTTNSAPATWSANVVATSTVDHAAGLYLEDDLVLDGPAVQSVGAFVKDGPGTLTFAGNWDYALAKSVRIPKYLGGASNNSKDPDWFDDFGNSRFSYAGGAIFRGKMVVGRPGVDESPNVTIGDNEFWVGTFTTTNGTEYAGELEVNSGSFRVLNNFLCVPRNNGWTDTQSEEWLESKVTVNGGLLEVCKFILGYDNLEKSKTRPVVTVNGGVFRQTSTDANSARFGNNYGRGCDVSFIVNGGRAEFAGTGLFNFAGQWSPNVVFEMNGGFVDFAGGVSIGHARSCQFNLNGGTLRIVGGFVAANSNNRISCGGTTIRLVGSADVAIGGFGSPTLTAGGLTLDTTEQTGGWLNFNSAFSGEGGVTVVGTNASRAVCFRSVQAFTGDVVAEPGAGVAVNDGALASQTVRLKNGAAIWNTGVSASAENVGTLVMGEGDSDVTMLNSMYYAGGASTPLTVANSLTVNGTVKVGLRNGGDDRTTPAFDGTLSVLRAPKGQIDAAKFALDAEAYPTFQATFAVDSSDATYDVLTMAIATASEHVHAWTAAGGGDWDEAANWSAVPDDAPGDRIVFPSSFAGGAVAVSGERTLGRLSSAAQGEVAIAGGALAIAGGDVAVASGTLVLPDVSSANDLRVDVEKGATAELAGTTAARSVATPKTQDAGTLRVTGELKCDVAVTSGRLEVRPEALGERTVSIAGATLRPIKSGRSTANLSSTTSRMGFAIDVPEGVECVHAGKFKSKRFFKTGAGALWLTPFASDWTMSDSTGNAISGKQIVLPENGDVTAEGLGAVAVLGGRLAMGRAGETIRVYGGEFWVGSCPTFGADGKVLDATLDFYDGHLILGSFMGVGRSWNVSFRDLDRLPVYTFNQYGGTIEAPSLVMNWDNCCLQCSHAVYNMHGGTLSFKNRFALGSHRSKDATAVAKIGESVSDFNVYGGTVSLNGMNEGASLSGHNGDGCLGRLNMHGGTFKSDVVLQITRAESAKGALLLAGGTLVAPNLTQVAGSTSSITWDGGTFRPSSAATLSGMTTNQVAAGGAVVDVSLVDSFTIDQTLTHASACEGADGGLTKTGAGTLLLKKPMAFTGPLSVLDGAADLNGASAYELAGVEGCGRVTNGTAVVSGWVEPRGADAEAAGAGSVLTVDSLVFGEGSVWKANAREGEGGWTADELRVEGSLLSAAGAVTVDFAHSADDPLPDGFRARIASFAAAPDTRLRFTATGHGLSRGRSLAVRYENGTEIWATAVTSGTVLILR